MYVFDEICEFRWRMFDCLLKYVILRLGEDSSDRQGVAAAAYSGRVSATYDKSLKN